MSQEQIIDQRTGEAGETPSTVIYETWYDFITHEGERFIRERTVVVEPDEENEFGYIPRSTMRTAVYLRAEIISKVPTRFGRFDAWSVIGIGPDAEENVPQLGIFDLSNTLEESFRAEGGRPKMRARYVEHLHHVDESAYRPGVGDRLPVLYVRRALPEQDHKFCSMNLIFTVNIPLGVYQISPPPFERAINKIGNTGCRKKLIEKRAFWHALVFERPSSPDKDPFLVDCEESLRVLPYFVRYLLPGGLWRLSLFVHNPRPGRIYGIHMPIPLTAFQP